MAAQQLYYKNQLITFSHVTCKWLGYYLHAGLNLTWTFKAKIAFIFFLNINESCYHCMNTDMKINAIFVFRCAWRSFFNNKLTYLPIWFIFKSVSLKVIELIFRNNSSSFHFSLYSFGKFTLHGSNILNSNLFLKINLYKVYLFSDLLILNFPQRSK